MPKEKDFMITCELQQIQDIRNRKNQEYTDNCLANLLNANTNHDTRGVTEEIFQIYEESSDKYHIRELFEALTETPFASFLQQLYQETPCKIIQISQMETYMTIAENSGYQIVDYEGTNMFVIQKDDVSTRFKTDEEAIEQARKAGIPMIPNDWFPERFNLLKDGWVDTPENRTAIKHYCEDLASEYANLLNQAYKLYQTQWILSNKIGITDLIAEVQNHVNNIGNSEYMEFPNAIEMAYQDWEKDCGFGGMLWACKPEFEETEFQSYEAMRSLLPDDMFETWNRLMYAEKQETGIKTCEANALFDITKEIDRFPEIPVEKIQKHLSTGNEIVIKKLGCSFKHPKKILAVINWRTRIFYFRFHILNDRITYMSEYQTDPAIPGHVLEKTTDMTRAIMRNNPDTLIDRDLMSDMEDLTTAMAEYAKDHPEDIIH